MEALITAATSPPTRSHSPLVSPIPPPPPLTPARRVFSDITNFINSNSPRRRIATSIGSKIHIVREMEKKIEEGVAVPAHVWQTHSRYKAIVDERFATPKKQRIAMTRKRVDGGGRKPVFTTALDQELLQWVTDLRKNRESASRC